LKHSSFKLPNEPERAFDEVLALDEVELGLVHFSILFTVGLNMCEDDEICF